MPLVHRAVWFRAHWIHEMVALVPHSSSAGAAPASKTLAAAFPAEHPPLAQQLEPKDSL